MELRDIEVFLAVARSGSLKGAALDRSRTSSALSKALRRVEHELGVELFDRSGSCLRLTMAGHQFTPHAEQIVRSLDRAKRSLRAGAAGCA